MPVDWNDVDVTAIVQEIVNQSGWGSGNALSLLFITDSGSYYAAGWIGYDYDPTRAPKLKIDFTMPYDVLTDEHPSGQVADQFDGATSQNDAPLFRFRLTNTSAGAVTVDQIDFPLSSVAGIVNGDLSDLRVHDGTANVVTGGTASIAGATGTFSFANNWAIPAGTAVDYTVYGDAANLTKDDTLTLGFSAANMTLHRSRQGRHESDRRDPHHRRRRAPGRARRRAGGRRPRRRPLPGLTPTLFAFRLQNTTAEELTVNEIVLQLSSVTGIDAVDLSDLRINNGTAGRHRGRLRRHQRRRRHDHLLGALRPARERHRGLHGHRRRRRPRQGRHSHRSAWAPAT